MPPSGAASTGKLKAASARATTALKRRVLSLMMSLLANVSFDCQLNDLNELMLRASRNREGALSSVVCAVQALPNTATRPKWRFVLPGGAGPRTNSRFW
jgi:hypothetical protein